MEIIKILYKYVAFRWIKDHTGKLSSKNQGGINLY